MGFFAHYCIPRVDSVNSVKLLAGVKTWQTVEIARLTIAEIEYPCIIYLFTMYVPFSNIFDFLDVHTDMHS